VDLHRRSRQLDIPRRVLVRAAGDAVSERHAVLIGRTRRRSEREPVRIAVARLGCLADERVRGGEIREELLEAALPASAEHRVEVRGRVDAVRHERVDEIVAARLLARELEEQVARP
jgi:hypothetical protein